MNRKSVKHLSLEDRKILNLELLKDFPSPKIARKINRSAVTVANEIAKHRKLKPRNTFNMDIIRIHLKESVDVLKNAKDTKNCLVHEETVILVLAIVVIK